MGLFDDLKPTPEKEAPKPEKKEIARRAPGAVSVTGTDDKASLTAGNEKDYEVTVKNDSEYESFRVVVDAKPFSESPDPAEWPVKVRGITEKVWDVTFTKEMEKGLKVPPGSTTEFTVVVEAPKGAVYGDSLNLTLKVTSSDDPGITDTLNLVTSARQAIMAVKTSIGYERAVADSLGSRAKAKGSGVFAILSPRELQGYLIVESMNPDRLEEMVRGIGRARGVVHGETSFGEIDHFLSPKALVSGIKEGDIVELVAGPFKGERARVTVVDEAKEEITVELFEAVVPIPVTVRGDQVRVLAKEEKQSGK